MLLPEKIQPIEMQIRLDTTELRVQLVAQIEKDMGLEPFKISAEAPDFFDLLNRELYYTLQAVIERQPQLLPNMIYRIDIDERTVNLALTNPDTDASETLATLILNREMKKIFYRNVFSGKIKL